MEDRSGLTLVLMVVIHHVLNVYCFQSVFLNLLKTVPSKCIFIVYYKDEINSFNLSFSLFSSTYHKNCVNISKKLNICKRSRTASNTVSFFEIGLIYCPSVFDTFHPSCNEYHQVYILTIVQI